MYAGRNDSILIDDWVNADIRLDPEGKTLPMDRFLESHAMKLRPRGADGAVLKEPMEKRASESQALREAITRRPSEAPDPSAQTGNEPDRAENDTAEVPLPPSHEYDERIHRLAREEDMAWSSGPPPILLEVHLEGEDFLAVISDAYASDTLFSKVLLHPEQHPRFTVKNKIIYCT